jgi:hypothetical protein
MMAAKMTMNTISARPSLRLNPGPTSGFLVFSYA